MAPSSSGSIRVSRLALMIAAVIAPLATIGLPVVAWISGSPLEQPVHAGDPAPLPPTLAEATARAQLEWDGTALASLADPSAQQRVVAMLPEALTGIAVAVVALLLLRVIDRISSGAAFTPASVRTLRGIAVIIVAATVVVPYLQAFATSTISFAAVVDDHAGWSMSFPLAWFGVAALVGAVAEAFAQGVRMSDDVEGLV